MVDGFEIKTPTVVLGKSLDFDVQLTSRANKTQPLIIDFVIHYQRANGELSPQVYKWKSLKLNPSESVTLGKQQTIRQITTRTFHAGTHRLEIQINGQKFAEGPFELTL